MRESRYRRKNGEPTGTQGVRRTLFKLLRSFGKSNPDSSEINSQIDRFTREISGKFAQKLNACSVLRISSKHEFPPKFSPFETILLPHRESRLQPAFVGRRSNPAPDISLPVAAGDPESLAPPATSPSARIPEAFAK